MAERMGKGVRRASNRKRRENIEAWAFSLPYLLLFAAFVIVPVLISLGLGFTRFNLLQPPKLVFADNYVRLFLNDELFPTALKNTLIYAAVTGPVGYLLCFFFAWCMNEVTPKLRTLFLLCLYAPSISGNAYLIWTLLFSSDSHGYVNALLLNMGLIYTPIQFFQNPDFILPLTIGVVLWMSLGTSLLAFVAGFQGIDRTLYEAGAVDGIRNRWQELWYITLPAMRPQMLFSAVMSITSSFGIGDVLTGLTGNPSYKYMAYTLMHHLQDYGNARFEMGYASAIATVLFVMMIGCNLLVQKILSRVGE